MDSCDLAILNIVMFTDVVSGHVRIAHHARISISVHPLGYEVWHRSVEQILLRQLACLGPFGIRELDVPNKLICVEGIKGRCSRQIQISATDFERALHLTFVMPAEAIITNVLGKALCSVDQ